MQIINWMWQKRQKSGIISKKKSDICIYARFFVILHDFCDYATHTMQNKQIITK